MASSTGSSSPTHTRPPHIILDMKKIVLHNLKSRQGSWRIYGNYRVYCGGRILIGPVRSWWWLLEIFVIIVTFTFIAEYQKYNLWVWITGLAIFCVVIGSSWKTLMMDPGIVKKPTFLEAMENAKEAAELLPPGILAGVSREMHSDTGEPVTYTYCFRCHVWRPPHAGHCSICGCCQLSWDHHCPIFGGCVARKNVGAFYIMTSSIPIFVAYLVVTSCFSGWDWYKEKKLNNIMLASIVLDEILIGIVLAIILPPMLAYLPCEAEVRDPPPDNQPSREIIVQMLAANGRRTISPHRNGLRGLVSTTTDQDSESV